MASKKKVVGIIIPVIIAILGIGTTGASTNWTFDFSTTTIGQIGDNTIITNYVLDNFGVDLNEFKKMCDEGIIPEEAQVYCRLL